MADFTQSRLWRAAYWDDRADCSSQEQEFYKTAFLAMRDKVMPLVAKIHADMPGYTVHDISHLDALWEMASILLSHPSDINPAEAFVFGAAALLHDAGMTLAAYPGGLADLRKTIEWKDTLGNL